MLVIDEAASYVNVADDGVYVGQEIPSGTIELASAGTCPGGGCEIAICRWELSMAPCSLLSSATLVGGAEATGPGGVFVSHDVRLSVGEPTGGRSYCTYAPFSVVEETPGIWRASSSWATTTDRELFMVLYAFVAP